MPYSSEEGHTLARPKGLESRLGGTVGSVADPAFVMRRRLSIEPGEQVQLTAVTGAAGTKEQALEISSQLSQEQQVERSFQLAWTRSQIELQHLHITSADAAVYQLLAGRALYMAPLREEQEKQYCCECERTAGLVGAWRIW